MTSTPRNVISELRAQNGALRHELLVMLVSGLKHSRAPKCRSCFTSPLVVMLHPHPHQRFFEARALTRPRIPKLLPFYTL